MIKVYEFNDVDELNEFLEDVEPHNVIRIIPVVMEDIGVMGSTSTNIHYVLTVREKD